MSISMLEPPCDLFSLVSLLQWLREGERERMVSGGGQLFIGRTRQVLTSFWPWLPCRPSLDVRLISITFHLPPVHH